MNPSSPSCSDGSGAWGAVPTGLLSAFLLLAAAAPAALAQEPARRATPAHDTDYVPSTEYVTPHIPLAKPYVKGPEKALFIVWAPGGRHVVELDQRMDLEFDYVGAGQNNLMWRASGTNYPGRVSEDCWPRARALLAKPHEAIVVGALPWAALPEDVRAGILKQVEAGTGLVVSFRDTLPPTDKEPDLFALYQKAQPAPEGDYFPGDGAKTVEHGRGRVAFVAYPWVPRFDDFWGDVTGYERQDVDRFVRTLLWAARKEPDADVSLPARQDAGPWTVRIANRGPALKGTLEAVLRRELDLEYPLLYGRLFYQLRPYASWEEQAAVQVPFEAAAQGEATVALDVPMPAAGVFSLDLTLKDEQGKVIAWRRAPLRVAVPGARIAELRFGKAPDQLVNGLDGVPQVWFAPQDTFHAQVKAQGEALDAPAIRLSLSDVDGRVIAAETAPGLEAPFTLSLASALHRLLIVKAELLDGDRPLAEVRAPAFVVERPDRAPAFTLRLFGVSLLRPDYTTATVSYFGGYNIPREESELLHAWHDVRLRSGIGDLLEIPDITPDFARTPSIFDPDHRAKKVESVRLGYARTAAPGHPGDSSFICDEWTWGYVGDEGKSRRVSWPQTPNQDRSPHALAAFRRYVRSAYPDLAALNAEWGTTFPDWEEVAPPLLDADPARPPDEALWPRIVDHQLFNQRALGDYIAELAAAAREANPANRLGSSGHYTVGMWTGVDYYLWAKHAPHASPYFDPFIWQSFTPERVACWRAYGDHLADPITEEARAWDSLFRGIENSLWSREWPVFRPDMTPNPAPGALFAALREIRDRRIADLLVPAETPNRIGILYHPASSMVYDLNDWTARGLDYYRDIYRRKKYPNYLGRYLEVGMPFWMWHYVHTDQFLHDGFGRYGKPAVVFLPLTEALSDAEAGALREYVREGGILVADLNAGVRDEHGKRRATGALDDVFGIRRTGYRPPVTDPPLNLRPLLEAQQSIDALAPALRPTQAPHAPGKFGRALRFNGRNQYVQVPYDASLEPKQLTIEAWAKIPADAAGTGTLVSKNGNESRDGYYALAVADGNVGALLNIGGKDGLFAAWSADKPLKRDTWHHVTMTFDGATLAAYCDGKQVAATAVNKERTPQPPFGDPKDMATGHLTQNVRPDALAIGRKQFVGDHFEGLLDEVRLWGRALSAEEVAREARAAGGPEAPPEGAGGVAGDGPVARWSFDADMGTLIRDDSGNGRDGAYAFFGVVGPATRQRVRFADGGESFSPLGGGATVEAAGATVMASLDLGDAKAPAFLVNEFGRGRAVYLNFVPWDDAVFRRIRALAGLEPDWTLDAGKPPVVTFVREYRRGGHRYFGCLGNIEAGWPWSDPAARRALDAGAATIRLPRAMHVYDVRRGEYLSERDAIEVRFGPDRMGQVFACLPYRVEGVRIEGVQDLYRGGEAVRFRARVLPAAADGETHALRIRVVNPEGQPVRIYDDALETRGGVAQGEVPLALSDMPGTWRLIVTDIATGLGAEEMFRVR